MTDEATLHLAERIAAIEARGTGHLRAAARRQAIEIGLRVAIPATLPVPALAALAGWFAPLRWDMVGPATLAVPLAAFGIGFLHHWRRQRIERAAALALFDRELALKDRITTADEFLRHPGSDGFRAAAVLEARPWIERAATAAVPQSPRPVSAGRRWPLMLAGAALLLVAGAVEQRFVPATGAGRQVAAALVAAGIAAPGAGAERLDNTAPDTAGSSGASTVNPAPSGTSAAHEAGQQADGAGKDSGRLGGAQPAAGSDQPGTRASGTDSASAPQPGEARQAGAGAGAAGNPDRNGADQDRRQGAAGRIDADRNAGADGQAGQRSGTAPQNGANAGNQPPSSSPLGSQQRPQTGQSGNGSQPNQQNRSQQGAQDQSQPGQGKGQGRDGQRAGQDALKRANGLAALLLAVPMRDRLGGTANAGPVSSLPRQAPPHAGSAGAATAADRGSATGDVGRIVHQPATPQDQQLLQRYFRPARRASDGGGER